MVRKERSRRAVRVVPPVFANYQPVKVLWSGPSPTYESEQQARWAIRQHRQELAASSALALYRGRLLVHPQVFVQVVERAAIDAAQRRAAPSPRNSGEE
jgi:hypothetical protein